MRYRIHNSNLTFALSQGPKVRSAASIILRGPSDMYCDEMERSIHDALCVVKVAFHLFLIVHVKVFNKDVNNHTSQRVLESKSVVVGGGCVEAALSIYLENFATSLSSR